MSDTITKYESMFNEEPLPPHPPLKEYAQEQINRWTQTLTGEHKDYLEFMYLPVKDKLSDKVKIALSDANIYLQNTQVKGNDNCIYVNLSDSDSGIISAKHFIYTCKDKNDKYVEVTEKGLLRNIKIFIGEVECGETPKNLKPTDFTVDLNATMEKNIERYQELKLEDRIVKHNPFPTPSTKEEFKGQKESENKVDYTELDWDFIDAMALRMSSEDKYPKDNWKKPIDIIELIKPIIRHGRKLLQPIEGDEETTYEHCIALALNAMMAAYQIKNNNE